LTGWLCEAVHTFGIAVFKVDSMEPSVSGHRGRRSASNRTRRRWLRV